ncbi:hypothetical protein ABQ473_27430 [Klebsiella oxytoca]|uniref:hypothetical protein n=1 Tax=Klebsiella oxytoca TaxID=571 RepID=UPI003AAC455F
MITTYNLSEILMMWAVFGLCVWLTKHYTRLELSNLLSSGEGTFSYAIAFVLYRAGLMAFMLACLAAMLIAIGYSLGYLGLYRM